MEAMSAQAFKARLLDLGYQNLFKRSALNIRDGAGVLEKVLGTGLYRTVLEIGTYKGVSAAYIAGFCEHVITIDLHHGRLEQVKEPWDRELFWEEVGADNITLKLVEDNIEKKRYVDTLDFDMAFIDGGKNDIEFDFNLVKRCGTVLFHDYDHRDGIDVNSVYDFVNSLPKEEVTVMDIFALWRAP